MLGSAVTAIKKGPEYEGGHGALERTTGLSIDSLVSCTVVLASGEVVLPPMEIQKLSLSSTKLQRHGIDREVAPSQVINEQTWIHYWIFTRRWVVLLA